MKKRKLLRKNTLLLILVASLIFAQCLQVKSLGARSFEDEDNPRNVDGKLSELNLTGSGYGITSDELSYWAGNLSGGRENDGDGYEVFGTSTIYNLCVEEGYHKIYLNGLTLKTSNGAGIVIGSYAKVDLILRDNSINTIEGTGKSYYGTVNPGIMVEPGGELNIRSESQGENCGKLIVKGGDAVDSYGGGAAGIGGSGGEKSGNNREDCGSINIMGGDIEVTGGSSVYGGAGAAIGGGGACAGDDQTTDSLAGDGKTGGSVTQIAYTGGKLKCSAGKSNATGGNAAIIGGGGGGAAGRNMDSSPNACHGGNGGNSGKITLGGGLFVGDMLFSPAEGGKNSSTENLNGANGAGLELCISADGLFQVAENQIIQIANGITLCNEGTIKNDGTLNIDGTLDNKAYYEGNGVINGNGTVIGIHELTWNNNDGSELRTEKVGTKLKPAKYLNPTRSGFTFSGWYRDQKLSKSWKLDSDSITEDMILYAGWKKKGVPIASKSKKIPKIIIYKIGKEPISEKLVRPIVSKSYSNKIRWSRVEGADGYYIYGARCNKKKKKEKIELIKDITSKTKTTFVQTKLKKNTWYKYEIIAYKKIDGKKITFARSLDLHTLTRGNKKYTNPSKVVAPSKLVLRLGHTKHIKAKVSLAKRKKTDWHTARVRFLVSNKNVVSISMKGKITARKKGVCNIFAVAQNGKYKKIKVIVK